jgi:hypothetical protein
MLQPYLNSHHFKSFDLNKLIQPLQIENWSLPPHLSWEPGKMWSKNLELLDPLVLWFY